jgi:hypothetical protein
MSIVRRRLSVASRRPLDARHHVSVDDSASLNAPAGSAN